MSKYKHILIMVISSLTLPLITKADPFTNPAGGFLIDLNNRGGNTFPNLILVIINAVLGVVGILCMALIIYGGFQYIVSRGDEEMAAAGKKTLSNAVIGLVIIIFSYIIVKLIIETLIGVK